MSQIRHSPVAPTHTLLQSGGDVIDRHRHDDHQLIYVSHGVSAIRTGHGAWIASRDRALWVPAQTWHEHRFYGDSTFHTIGFPTGSGFPTGPAPLPADTPVVVAVDPLLRELLIALTGEPLGAVETGHIHAVLGDRLRAASVAPFLLPVPRDPRLAEACRLVEDDLRQPRTLAWLAGRVHASERTLSRLFRTEFGTTYPQWRTRTRVFAAMVRLAQGESVTATGRACGWATTSAFVDTFARTMGTTPGRQRRPGSAPDLQT